MSEPGTHYLFSYGSLMNPENRRMTAVSLQEVPAVVTGIRRAWNYLIEDMGIIGLGAVFASQTECNGLLLEVSAEELAKFDAREVNYDRCIVSPDKVEPHPPEGVTVHAYILQKAVVPSLRHPMTQSYIDVVISGCLAQGEAFAETFVRNTVGWNANWVDDRASPVYRRHTSMKCDFNAIDALLRRCLGDGLPERRPVHTWEC